MATTGHMRLYAILGVAVLALVFARNVLVKRSDRADAPAMCRAEALASQWFDIIEARKRQAGIVREVPQSFKYSGMLGQEWSEFTTTLGSLEAKRTAANPRFAALMIRLLHDAGVDSSSTVGVVLSGSFPTLAVASLAAVQTIGARAVILSSLGSSSFGANQSGATWLDMEDWLREDGGLHYRSALVTMGAEGDSGGGLSEEGLQILSRTAERHGVALSVFPTFANAVQSKEEMLLSAHPDVLVNIGGNQTSLGICEHASTIPTGLIPHPLHCSNPGRGLIERFSSRNIPVVHLLNIRDIASRYDLPLLPDIDGSLANDNVLYDATVDRGPVVLLICGLLGLIALHRLLRSGSFTIGDAFRRFMT